MKKNLLAIIPAVFTATVLCTSTFAQSVGINTNAPHPSAILDVFSADKGFLMPRLSTEQRNAITAPAEGLLILNTSTGCINVYYAGTWSNTSERKNWYADADGDGFTNHNSVKTSCFQPEGYLSIDNYDCNDNNSTVYPGAAEICDGLDNDCDGQIDEGVKLTFYADADGDGFGDASNTTEACTAPTGYVSNSNDCDDNNAAVHPNATEVCNGIDDNCDGQIDEGVKLTFYADADGDGFGDASNTTEACTAPTGYVTDNTDCDDNNAAVHPNATEVCNGIDDDCDGQIDEGVKLTFYADADGDGFGDASNTTEACTAPTGYVTDNTDCDDNNAAVHPNATEVCNGIDDDCDGQIDEGVKLTFYADADGDGFGDASNTTEACTAPTGYVSNSNDCDDNNAAVHPNATEVCNGIDDNCDGQIDEGVKLTFYADADGDGFGDASNTTEACTAPTGYVSNSNDCDDNNAAVHPNATEVCNGIDDDCDGQIDEGVKLTFYADADGDGFGDAANTTQACTAPTGYVSNSNDCDDNNAAVHPNATEVCNGIDDDCDGQIDEGVKLTFYADADGDGFGDASNTTEACTAPTGYVTDNTDCDDNNAAVHPNATEVCNGIDDDCDGQIDEGVKLTFYADADGDGFGDASNTTEACTAPTGYVSNNFDCDDSNPAVNPGATEVCDGIDNDCDALIDAADPSLSGGVQYYLDNDADGFGDPNNMVINCSTPVGYVDNNSDCDDNNAAVFPGANEVCNGIDDNCDGQVDENPVDGNTYYADADADGFGNPLVSIKACSLPNGYVANNTDCDDSNNAIYPGANEVCNGIDDDCDGQVDENPVDGNTYYADADGDGFGDPSVSIKACTLQNGYVTDNTDCDDGNTSVNPNAPEICDGLDNDCNGTIDDNPIDGTIYYYDFDEDGYGNPNAFEILCAPPINPPAAMVLDGTDCDDFNFSVNPGTPEICDGADNNCDGQVDEGCDDLDNDSDGFSTAQGDCNDFDPTSYPGAPELCGDFADNDCNGLVDEQCDTDGDGFSVLDGDCDDFDPSVYPGATEICDGIDNNCDGQVDEGLGCNLDNDGDGFSAYGGDCDDTNPAINPSAVETCNGIDDDCNGVIDDPYAVGTQTFYADADGDGFGDAANSVQLCTMPPGYVTNSTDCNDADANVNPGHAEVPANGIDDNCNGQIDE